MRKTIVGAVCALALSAGALVGTANAAAPSCNWGELTAYAILELDFEQGPHSADPSGDGHGPGTNDEPRAGLANVVADGDLDATCLLIDDLLP